MAGPPDAGEDADGHQVGECGDPHPHRATLRWRHVVPGSSSSVHPPRRRRRGCMGIETEYGISALGGPVEDDLHPMQLSNHVVKAYGWSTPGQPAGWDYETETPLRDIRGYEISRASGPPRSADRHRSRHGERDLDQRRPAVRRPRPPGVLRPGGHLGPGRRPLRPGRRRRDGHRRAAGQPEPRPVGAAVQEQHRRQGRLVRDARELPAGPRAPRSTASSPSSPASWYPGR